MVRFNPGIGAGHHAKVITAGKATKFGVTPDKLDDVLALLKRHNLTLAGINQHIGSLFMEPDGYLNAATVLLHLAERLPAATLATLEVIDFGGGFGIPYHKYDNETRLDMADLGARLHALISDWAAQTGYQGRFLVEPGRYVAAECGVLLGRVHAVKNNGDRRYVGTDLGFNVLVRPAMYDSFHDFEIYEAPGACARDALPQTIVGNICESGDILAKDRTLPALHEGDVLGVLDAGAYGFTMGSNYNMRRRPAEVLIQSDGAARLIRRRENLEDPARCLISVTSLAAPPPQTSPAPDLSTAPRAVWRLTWPQMLMMYLMFFMGFVAVWVAGQLSAQVQAALGMVNQCGILLMVVAMAVPAGNGRGKPVLGVARVPRPALCCHHRGGQPGPGPDYCIGRLALRRPAAAPFASAGKHLSPHQRHVAGKHVKAARPVRYAHGRHVPPRARCCRPSGWPWACAPSICWAAWVWAWAGSACPSWAIWG